MIVSGTHNRICKYRHPIDGHGIARLQTRRHRSRQLVSPPANEHCSQFAATNCCLSPGEEAGNSRDANRPAMAATLKSP